MGAPANAIGLLLIHTNPYQQIIPWKERVVLATEFALREFQVLRKKHDFLSEGREHFAKHIDAYLASGRVLNEAMYFVWYVATEEKR